MMPTLTGVLRSALRYHSLAAGIASTLLTLLIAGDCPAENGSAPVPPPAQPHHDLTSMSIEDLMNVSVATVTTVSKKPEKATEAPGTVMVITAKDIRLRGYSTLTDVINDLPGMDPIGDYFSEIGTLVPVRGIVGNNLIIVLVNGMRVNPPGGEYMPFRSDISVREAEQIEVIYGPGSTLYGQDAISAVINIKTRKPSKPVVANAGADVGSYATRESWASLGGASPSDERINATGYFQYHDSNLSPLAQDYPQWWNGNNNTQSIWDYQNNAATLGGGSPPFRQDFGLNGFGRVEIDNNSFQIWARDSRRSSSEGGLPFGYLSEAIWEDRSIVAEGRNTVTISPDMKLESALTFNRYQIDPSSRYIWLNPAVSTTSWYMDDFKYGRGDGLTLEETLSVNPNPRISLVTGLVGSNFNIIPKSTIPGGANLNENIAAQGGNFYYYQNQNKTGPEYSIPQVVEADYNTYGAYAEGSWQASHSFRTILGLRVDRDTRFSQVPILPRAAAIYDLSHNLTAKYIFTEAYVAPALYFADSTYDNGTLLAEENKAIQPETATNNEVNLSYAKKNINLGLSVYYGQQNNLIVVSDQDEKVNQVGTVYVPNANGNGTSQVTLVQSANEGTSRNIGGDLYGKATFGSFSTWFSYSYVDFAATHEGMTTNLQGTSRHNGRLGVTWAVTPRFFLTPSLVIRSTPENVLPGPLTPEMSTPWQINLHALVTVTRQWDIFTDIKNLTNHLYALDGIQNYPIPQEAFTGVLGFRYTLR